MTNKFINLSNHPSGNWAEAQLAEAQRLGEILDIPFPMIPEHASRDEISALATHFLQVIQQASLGHPCTVHVMGEMTFTFALVTELKKLGYCCVASTTRRLVELQPDGTKNVRFEFCQFREY